MATASEQALFGDPLGVISQSIGDMLMNPMGGMVNVTPGVTWRQELSSPAAVGQHHFLGTVPGTGLSPLILLPLAST